MFSLALKELSAFSGLFLSRPCAGPWSLKGSAYCIITLALPLESPLGCLWQLSVFLLIAFATLFIPPRYSPSLNGKK